MSAPLIGVLALQGAFREHAQAVASLGAKTVEIRQRKHLDGIDALILPGGESTTITRLLNELDLMRPMRKMIRAGMPVFGTCAGLILLCSQVENHDQHGLGVLNATVRRNAFGRQVDSFETGLSVSGLSPTPFPAVFIRAPIITATGNNVQTLASLFMDGQDRPVAVRQGNILATSFHPELTPDMRIHDYFLRMCQAN